MVVVLSGSVIKSTENVTLYGFLWRTEKTCGLWGHVELLFVPDGGVMTALEEGTAQNEGICLIFISSR